jgi:hypothetical protein
VDMKMHEQLPIRRQSTVPLVLVAFVLLQGVAAAQGLTGALIGTVKDAQESAVSGATVRVSSASLLAGPAMVVTSQKGQWRFPDLPPGTYALEVTMPGFAPLRIEDIDIGAGATIERRVSLNVAGIAESIVVEAAGSRIDARNPGIGTRFGPEALAAIPTRRSSMFDAIRAAPGVSPTSPSSGTVTTISAFGSGTNENQFLIDGTNFTCPCNGVARSEPGVDFIHEVQVQSVGASAEFGSVQGAVINVVTRQGSDRFLSDASYYSQTSGLTSQPVLRPFATTTTGYERVRYRDLTGSIGGPAIRQRLWFFAGYQYLRDYDSQPAADPAHPRIYEQNKGFAKLTWNLAPAWRLMQSFHNEEWVNSDAPTLVTAFDATVRRSASVPAVTFGELTHTASANTLWDVRVARFRYSQTSAPSSGDPTIPSRTDSLTNVTTGAPPSLGSPTITRITAKTTLSHYQTAWLGADHLWKIGSQLEHGEHHAVNLVPGGMRFVDSGGRPVQRISTAPANVGGLSISASAFASDSITVADRLTVNAGLRFDHLRAISQDLPGLDSQGRKSADIVDGLGTLYTWNLLSPRLGLTSKLTQDARTMLRASYGRFSQGVMTGELEPFHPGAQSITTATYDPVLLTYTSNISVVDPRTNLLLDADVRAPHTDEYSVGVDREVGGGVAVAGAYIRKNGADFIGWTDVGGQYREGTQTLRDGRVIPVFDLVNSPAARRFLLTNPEEYSLAYNGLVMMVEKRPSHGWQASGSYTLSKSYGLQPSSGTTAAGAQVSTVSPPPLLTFGRDPNDLTNARGRLANDRPHIARMATSVDIARTGVVVAANFQYFSGKPWAATAVVPTTQNAQQRILLEPRGSRRLSSQSLLDLRVSKAVRVRGVGRIELLLDVLNAMNDTAEESVASDNFFGPTFAQPNVFVDPRRAMLGARVNLGR